MIKESNLKRVIKGAVAGAVAGIVASWAANQFHSLWSHLAGEGENTEVARLSDRGGRPDTAAAKEKVASGGPLQEDATIAIAYREFQKRCWIGRLRRKKSIKQELGFIMPSGPPRGRCTGLFPS